MAESHNWLPAYIGLGSNLNEPAAQLRAALAELAAVPATRLVAMSGFYANPPMGPQDQPDFVNAVAGLLTQLAPAALLAHLQELERKLGRQRKAGDRWGPRVIDLDLLVFGQLQHSEPGLTVPHPGISERNFVLFPLCDIAPFLRIPGQGMVGALAARVGAEGLTRLD